MASEKKGILLEAGTGEVEILEFVVNEVHYAINVIKVKEILEIDYITKVPNSSPAVAGLTLVRGDVVTLIDMKQVLEKTNSDLKKAKTILCEFNQMKVAFCVDSIVGIHRIGWDDIKKPDNINESSLVIGNIILGDKIIMLLDFEKIVMDINPGSGIGEKRMENIANVDRSNIKMVLADDSPLIRRVLNDTLTKAGFKHLRFFDDGQQALNYLKAIEEKKGENFIEDVQMLITDIEMPQMDGHTLTRKIKEDKILKKLPVIIFSSLITDDLMHKGEAVGADAQMSKPEIGKLVSLIDKLITEKGL
ncbi:chemotaxis protein [Tepidibacter formicigenes]|jgi:two-component system chemotaxis response regulator CheV|uniref:Stage 0 sporulation protein A homolog n=1 Tax=Tepidibacter formicigenes DSM 15518 TaxID=1123349 RepID=A0A1M6NXF7_9FIRM|nr:chemotaxis protein [Tepidibacter formicigenes]SHK00321.1 two-component system, chemotaxis family, response regulator CheV [Tepidibacter formicigenes DSM 15518]